MFNLSSEQAPIFSVTELNRETKRLLNQHFLSIRVEGEISNLSTPSSGHIYFSLKDANAQVRCAMFRMHQRRLAFKPTNGKQVIVTAQVSLYEPRGDYQLIVEAMEEAGAGALRQAFERLKQKLLAEGLFEPSRKQAIPSLPAQIGIITSPTGAAIHDIMTVLKRRFPAIPVVIYPVAVQGDGAKAEIVKALQTANQRQEADVLIVARGGGSLEDLQAFNEESVARAIAASQIPIISGVGHEVDFTISDFVADLRAPTPSAAAEHAAPEQNEWLNSFRAYEARLQQLIQQKLTQHKQALDWLNRSLQQQHPGQQLQRNAQRLDELENRLQRIWRQQLQQCQAQLEAKSQALTRHNPAEKICQQQQKLLYFEERIKRAMQQKLEQLQRRQAGICQTLHAVSPLATLERGYAIVSDRQSGEIIKSSRQLNPGDILETRLGEGRYTSQVKEIEHD
ncbi:exodeoxyribonuclease VII large subunit [Methylomarinum sp. Ch1-1]|uniref:Exodeoxyribonuclease 7 large subunit n=1 Tax=Methylomarinum roseum TaxID=3067653 RepID=A0AAU7NUM4_9GAMM|nr:exodeoxyribonuclease VII large subunit [Methylomarinum sp. Ch1-1]MDP4519185.1 exodeoxyribonuclease VII large subunit [Methylomarinum sp. Ch1-1]